MFIYEWLGLGQSVVSKSAGLEVNLRKDHPSAFAYAETLPKVSDILAILKAHSIAIDALEKNHISEGILFGPDVSEDLWRIQSSSDYPKCTGTALMLYALKKHDIDLQELLKYSWGWDVAPAGDGVSLYIEKQRADIEAVLQQQDPDELPDRDDGVWKQILSALKEHDEKIQDLRKKFGIPEKDSKCGVFSGGGKAEVQTEIKLVFSEIFNGCFRVCYIEGGYYYIHHHKRSGPDDSYSLYYKETTESFSDINDGPRGPGEPAESIGTSIGRTHSSWDEAIRAAEEDYLQYRK